MSNILRSFLLLLLAAPLLQAQGFEGRWIGRLTQNLDPPFDEYRIRLDLKQVDDIVTGVSHIHLPENLQISAEMELRGVVKDNKLYFREPRLLSSHHFSDWDWCLKRGILVLEDIGGILQLSGKWEGFVGDTPCESGDIIVEQADFRPDPLALNKGEEVKKNEVKVKEQKVEQRPKEEPKEKHYGALAGRPITRQAIVPVGKREFTAYIWDANKEDGDVVSLQYNGEWLLQDYSLKNAKRPIKIKLVPGGDNRLILYAENVGSIPPNTCALTFHDGERMRTLSLVSDKVSCGALKFQLRD